jgi:hypothetical protein
MKFARKTVGYTWTDYKTNTEIAKELNITPVLDKIQDYRKKWIQNINEMPRKKLLRIIKETTDQKSEGTRGDQSRDFWKCENETGRQVAPLHDS